MNIKYKKLLLVAGVINVIIGGFFLINGVTEFTNIFQTKANTLVQTAGIQLSYLIFIGAILTTFAGIVTILNRDTLRLMNFRVFLGISTLAWPLFLSITLLFTRVIINIRLLIMTLSAIFYVVSVLIVKITNAEFAKSVKFNPSSVISSSGKRAKSVNIGSVVSSTAVKVQPKNISHAVENLTANMTKRTHSFANVDKLLIGKRKHNGGFFKGLYSGKKRRRSSLFSSIYGRKRRRSSFRFRR